VPVIDEISRDNWNMSSRNSDIRSALDNWANNGTGGDFALATLCHLEGAAPRPLGTQMLFARDDSGAMRMSGYFSGGCIEHDVAKHAGEVLENGQPRMLVYGTGSPWIDIRLTCGGSMHILVERVNAHALALGRLRHADATREPALWTSNGWARQVLYATPNNCSTWRWSFDPETWCYSRIYLPRPRLLIVTNADASALALAELGSIAGIETWLWRPSGPATPCPIPGVRYVRSGIGGAGAWPVRLDAWTWVALMTHDSELDLVIAPWALRSEAGYVGVLGAGKRRPQFLHDLRHQGLSETQINKLCMPIGIGGCGKAPWEVATAILAQLFQLAWSSQPTT